MESLRSSLPCLPPIATPSDHFRAQFQSQPLAVIRPAKSGRGRWRTVAHAATGAGFTYSIQSRNSSSLVSEFMTKKEDLHVLKPSTPVSEALRALVESEIPSFPVIDEEWNLVGIVSDYDLLALASLPGGDADTNLFPEAHSSWKAFLEIQKLLCKTNGRVVSDVMTSTPLTVYETTSLEDATRLMLETKYARVPVVDGNGLLVGIITREDLVRAGRPINP
uniref:CBS domain-containing protein n=1 Tax=Kalanchoe fedtschenkoi TaxID=63787 RepID=A0A7N0T4U0_KALFE